MKPDHTSSPLKDEEREKKIARELDDSRTHRLLRLLSFLQEYGFHLLATIVASLLLLFLLFSWFHKGDGQSQMDYFCAEQQLATLQTLSLEPSLNEIEVEGALQKLNAILLRRKELSERYDAPLAQLLIALGRPEEAGVHAARSMRRIETNHPESLSHYLTSTRTALEVACEEKARALQEAKKLQEALKEENSQNLLQAYNDVRLAFLADSLGERDQAISFWQQVVRQLKKPASSEPTSSKPNPSPAWKEILSLFQEQSIELTSYAQTRIYANQ